MRARLLLFLLVPFHGLAQLAGEQVFTVLALSPDAGVAALGGTTVGNLTVDPALAWYNPALGRDTLHHRASAATGLQSAGITQYHAAYATGLGQTWTLTAGLFGVSYGSFEGRDIYGNTTGSFSGGETAVYATASRGYGPIRVGGGLKFLYSQLAGLSATAIAMDAGILLMPEGKRYTLGLTLRHAGVPLSTYDPGADPGELPLNITLGGTYRLKGSPFRLNLALTDLNTWVLLRTGATEEEAAFGENLTRRVVAGLEILAGKSLTLRFGYNNQRRQDLKSTEQNFGFAGLSLGMGLSLPRWGFDFAYAGYGAGGGTTHLGLHYRFTQHEKP